MTRTEELLLRFGDVSAEGNLDLEDLEAIPVPRAFTIVGIGGRHDVLDGSSPLFADAIGLELPSGKVIVYCQVHNCCGIKIWDSAEEAASHHGSYVRWSAPAPVRWP